MYPEGVVCSKCKSKRTYPVKGRTCYACHKGHHTYPLKGTMFEGTRIPLTKWFLAMYLMMQNKSGVSSMELQRHLGVSYQTAWRMSHKLREVMRLYERLEGEVEIDETFIGGRSEYRAKYFYGNLPIKEVVVGMVERGGRIKMVHTDKHEYNQYAALGIIGRNVLIDSTIYSDGAHTFRLLSRQGYLHGTVNHTTNFVNGSAHTQTIEGAWSQLKRSLYGTHRWVSAKHLQKYCDECSFRLNHRKTNAFNSLLEKTASV